MNKKYIFILNTEIIKYNNGISEFHLVCSNNIMYFKIIMNTTTNLELV